MYFPMCSENFLESEAVIFFIVPRILAVSIDYDVSRVPGCRRWLTWVGSNDLVSIHFEKVLWFNKGINSVNLWRDTHKLR